MKSYVVLLQESKLHRGSFVTDEYYLKAEREKIPDVDPFKLETSIELSKKYLKGKKFIRVGELPRSGKNEKDPSIKFHSSILGLTLSEFLTNEIAVCFAVWYTSGGAFQHRYTYILKELFE